jgi:alanine racemase
MNVHLEKTDFIIVGHSHTLAARRTGIVAYGLEPSAHLFMLVAAMRAGVAEENMQEALAE